MTSYESACLLISILRQFGIYANITAGGVSTSCKRYQRKNMIDIFNGMGESLDRVGIDVYLDGVCLYVNRKQGCAISVSHKRRY